MVHCGTLVYLRHLSLGIGALIMVVFVVESHVRDLTVGRLVTHDVLLDFVP